MKSLGHGYSFAGAHKQRSTIKPTPAFDDRVRPVLAGWEVFSRDEEPEVLILKGPKDRATGRAREIDYRETANTRRRRNEIHRINVILRNAPLKLLNRGDDDGDGGGGHVSCLLTGDGQPVDPTRRVLRRIFNNGSWHEHRPEKAKGIYAFECSSGSNGSPSATSGKLRRGKSEQSRIRRAMSRN